MGSSISGTIAEIFLQHIENIYTKQILDTKNLIFYTRYVDDILIIYDTKRTNPDIIHKYINQIHTNLQLNPTHENNRYMSFLDLLKTRKPTSLNTDIFRKPTTTDTTINFLSNHPSEPKIAAYQYYINRML